MNNLQTVLHQLILNNQLITKQKPLSLMNPHPAIKRQTKKVVHLKKKVWTIQAAPQIHLKNRTILQPLKTWQTTQHQASNKIKQLILQIKPKTTLLTLKMLQVIVLLKIILETRMSQMILQTLQTLLITVLVHRIKVKKIMDKIIKVLQITLQRTQTPRKMLQLTQTRQIMQQRIRVNKTKQKLRQMQTTIHHKAVKIAQITSQIIRQIMLITSQPKMKQTSKTKLTHQPMSPTILSINQIRLMSIILQIKTKLKLIIHQVNQTKPILIILQVKWTRLM